MHKILKLKDLHDKNNAVSSALGLDKKNQGTLIVNSSRNPNDRAENLGWNF
jgi:hypothetical protein